MTTKHRLKALEGAWLEAEIARIDRYYDTISEAELNLICTITEELQADALSREYTVAEIEFYNRHVDTINALPPGPMMERTRRQARELVTAGQATQAEIDEIIGAMR